MKTGEKIQAIIMLIASIAFIGVCFYTDTELGWWVLGISLGGAVLYTLDNKYG